MESNLRSVTDTDDQAQVIHLKEISVDFINKRPTSDLELVFKLKDDAGATRESNTFTNGARVHWNVNIYLKTHTSATLTIQRLGGLFKIRVAKVSVEFKPYKFGDDKVVSLEDSNHRVTVTFVYTKSKSPADVTRVLGSQTTSIAPMSTQQPSRRIPEVRFRVLIIGRANAGKTSILKRICETTESPVIYRGEEEVKLDPSMDRGEHRIDDELVFSNHWGYVFHDSRGIESGSAGELDILRKFIQSMCGKRRLRDRLHAIWLISRVFTITTTDGHILRYCVPMDNQRPQLDLKFFNDICPERNVPVIAVFTKYDQFRRNVRIHVEDFGSPDDDVLDVAEKQFQEHYVSPLGDDVRFVRLEQMHKQSLGCDKLIETTAAALNDDIVGLMLLAVQRRNLELSVKTALKRVRSRTGMDIKDIVRECLFPFPYIWWISREFDLDLDLGFGDRRRSRDFFDGRFVDQIMSFPTIQNLTPISLGGYHLIFAVILILKQATFLRLSNMSAESALTRAEVDYRKGNVDSKILQHLTAPSQEHSDESFTRFIMAVDLASVEITLT